MKQEMDKDGTIYAVQYLRGFAALAVFLFHISSMTVALWGPAAAGVDHAGAAGVDLFFVISGFVMAMILSRPEPFSVRDFLVQRAARVVPGYYVATFAVYALALAAPAVFLTTSADPLVLLRSLAFLPVAGANGTTAPLLVVGWTLDYEMFFYALCALAALAFGRRRLVALSAMLVALAVAGVALAPQHPTLRFYTDTILVEFVYGILIWRIYRSGALDRFPIVSFIAFGLGILLLALQIEREPGLFRPLVWGLPAALILLGSFRTFAFVNRPLALLGDWSYAFYLTHLFVIFGYVRLVMPHLSDLGIAWPWHYCAMTVLGLAVAAAYHLLVERPAGRYLRRRLMRRGAAGGSPAESLPEAA